MQNMRYAVIWRDVRTGETGQEPGDNAIRAAADCRAISLELQYPYREYSVVEIDPEKACGRTESTHSPSRVGGADG